MRLEAARALALAGVVTAEILGRLTGLPGLAPVSWVMLGATVLVSIPALGLRESYLLAVSATLSGIVLWTDPAPGAVLARGLDQGVFLMVFILLVGLLQEAAATSPAVAQVGRYLTRQPPGRRFYALYGGSGLLAILFNLGSVSLLVPLIERGIELSAPGDPLNPVRLRRQVSAALRGFAWVVIWSPTALAPLAVMQLIPGIDRGRWILDGIGVFLVMMLIGAVEDRIRFRSYRPRGAIVAEPLPRAAALRFLAVCGWLTVLVVAIVRLTGASPVLGIIIAAPAMALGWIAVQYAATERRPAALAAAVGTRIHAILFETLPRSAPVSVTLAASGYIGMMAAALVPSEALAAALHLNAIPDVVLLGALPLVIVGCSLFALSPIMLAVFFGSLFGSLGVPPADPTLLALSISCGWALSMTVSPFATPVLLISRMGRIAGTVLTFRWNGVFAALSAAALVPIFGLLLWLRAAGW